MSKGRTMPVVLEDQELRPENRLLTISKYCDIKKLLLIVCALSVKLGAGPLARGLPESSIAYVVVETLARPVDPKGCTFGEHKPPSGV